MAQKQEAVTQKSRFFFVPNLLTATRLFLIAPIVLSILTNNMVVAALLVVFSFCTDVADGRIARYLKQESSLGRVLDFTADRLNLIFLLSTLFFVGVFPWWALALIVGREAVMISYNVYLKIKGLTFVPPTIYGKATYVTFFALEFTFILNLYPLNFGFLIVAFVLMPISLASSLQKFFKTIKEA